MEYTIKKKLQQPKFLLKISKYLNNKKWYIFKIVSCLLKAETCILFGVWPDINAFSN